MNLRGGFRLLRIARPPILFYGLYGSDELDLADRRLAELILRRGILAGQLDCFLGCECTEPRVLCQIVLDKILYDLDRAIDLYALGNEELGRPETRAAAYSYVIDAARSLAINCGTAPPINGTLDIIVENLRPPTTASPSDDWADSSTLAFYGKSPATSPTPVFVGVGEQMVQELGIQKAAEARWQNLVETMAPNCIEITRVFGINGRLTTLINNSINSITGAAGNVVPAIPAFEPDIPRQYEDVLDRAGVVIR